MPLRERSDVIEHLAPLPAQGKKTAHTEHLTTEGCFSVTLHNSAGSQQCVALGNTVLSQPHTGSNDDKLKC